MIHITVRDFNQTLKAAETAAKELAENVDASDKEFMNAAWKLAETVAPAGSEPLAFLLYPETRKQYAHLKLDDASLKKIKGTDVSGQILTRLKRGHSFLLEECRQKLNEHLESLTTEDKTRRWVLRSFLTFNPSLNIPAASLPQLVHISTYLHFHFRDISNFCSRLVNLNEFETLTDFWKYFIRWHAGDIDEQMILHLIRFARDRKNQKAGQRKLALLLLWSMDIGKIKRHYKGIKSATSRYGYRLLRKQPFRGSPPLPVLPSICAGADRSTKDVIHDLNEFFQSNPKDEEKKKELVRELLGAYADKLKVEAEIKRQKPLRMLVVGGVPNDRYGTSILIGLIAGFPYGKQKEFSNRWISDHSEKLKSDISTFSQGGKAKGELAGLDKELLVFRDIHLWQTTAKNTIEPLFFRPQEEHTWAGSIVGNRSDVTIEIINNCCVTAGLCAERRNIVYLPVPNTIPNPRKQKRIKNVDQLPEMLQELYGCLTRKMQSTSAVIKRLKKKHPLMTKEYLQPSRICNQACRRNAAIKKWVDEHIDRSRRGYIRKIK